ncbi:hypothetical protein MNEG_0928, partial [Monoraphidium neglectum]
MMIGCRGAVDDSRTSPFESYAHYSFEEPMPLGRRRSSPVVALVLAATLLLTGLARPLSAAMGAPSNGSWGSQPG